MIGWILRELGNFRWTAERLTTFSTWNGPINWGANFRDSTCRSKSSSSSTFCWGGGGLSGCWVRRRSTSLWFLAADLKSAACASLSEGGPKQKELPYWAVATTQNGGQDALWQGTGLLVVQLPGEGVRFDIPRTRTIGECKVKASQKKSPSGLSWD